MLKWCFGLLSVLSLCACGVVYISPSVDQTDGKVRVVPMTPESVLIANRDTYRPKQIPNAYFQNAGSGPTGLRGPGASPPASLSEQQRPAGLTTRIPPAVVPGPYRIGVGDVVLLATKSGGSTVEELTGLLAAQNSREGYTIQDDGAIAVPDVGRIMLAELTLEEAEAQLFQTLVENQIDPTFSLEIAEFNSKRVAVGGAVDNPTVVPITLTPLNLDVALTRSGGIATPDLDFASIRIYRGGNLYQIPLARYLEDPDLQKTQLVAGDSVFVDTAFELDKARAYFEEQITLAQFRQQGRVQALAELNTEVNLRRSSLAEDRLNFQERIALDAVARDFVYLTGEVTKPGRVQLAFGRQTTLADALYANGGFSAQTANPSQVYVLRGSDADFGAVTAWHLDSRNVANMILATKLNLRPNDIIFVAEQPITRWNRVVQQMVPSLLNTGIAVAGN